MSLFNLMVFDQTFTFLVHVHVHVCVLTAILSCRYTEGGGLMHHIQSKCAHASLQQ